MTYNYLKDARLVKNSDLCRYDSKSAYSTDFSTNGDVYGWDLYNNIYLYGQWGGVLFGTAYDKECYIGRTLTFVPVAAEFYYIVQIMMKITTDDNNNKPTQGKLRWVTLNNSLWEEEKEYIFDLHTGDDQWYQYTLNLGPEQYWHGDINNLRIYPFIDGRYKDEFAIKYIRISSMNHFICSNRQCSYYSNYSHPCPGAGKSGSVSSGMEKEYYTTYSGVSDELLINIDDYGSEKIHLGTNINTSGRDMARIITNCVSRLNIGSYAYAYAEHTEYLRLKIHSGAVGSNTSVVLDGGSALESLDFIDSEGLDISVHEDGLDPESGFDYAGSRRLKGFEINDISNSDTKNIAYYHSPSQYNVEAGKRKFDNSSTANSLTYIIGSVDRVDTLPNIGGTIIDVSHPVNDSGRINHIYVNGNKESRGAKVLILKPHKNGDFTVVDELSFVPTIDAMYTRRHVTYRIDCDILVNKGDVFGFYNIDVAAPFNHLMNTPNAVYFKFSGKPTGRFNPGSVNAYGTMGFSFYARSDRLQTNAILEVDLGQRTNIESVSVFGRESNDYFEYNIASCLDVSWDVNLYGSTHRHLVCCYNVLKCFNVIHTNIAYGVSCLNDCRRSSDNGQQGDSYVLGSTGMVTVGDHAYFYVNGDSEWENSSVCNGKSEWCWQMPGGSGDCYATTHDYQTDPISFSLIFPYGFKTDVHKTIMYFKDDDNFRSFSISYYLGYDGSYGNGPLPNFQLVPKYNTIILDGMEYVYGSPEGFTYYDAVEDLLFKNPTAAPGAVYVNDECVNQTQLATAHHVNWNIIEHTFNPVECGGICIHTDYHNSTKINELEVYSMFPMCPTLVDNIDLQHSEYGEFWSTTAFVDDEYDNNRINTQVAASPRYLTIDISSQLDFELYGIGVYVSEEAKIENCEKAISLDDTKLGSTSSVKTIELENIFNRPYDLSVNLPRDLFTNTSILSWMTMDSEKSIKYPEVGPGGIIHKNADFPIRNNNLQCAINCPCYGLKNLLLEKEIYYHVHGSEDEWELFTTCSGESIGYYCHNICYETIITFDVVSAKYWKFTTHDTGTPCIASIECFYDDGREQIKYMYSDSPDGVYSQPNEYSVGTSSLVDENTGTYIDLLWSISNESGSVGVDTNSEIIGEHETIEVYSLPTITFTAEFDKLTDFTFTPYVYNQWVYNNNSYRDNHYIIYFLDEFDTEIIKIVFKNTLTTVYEYFYYRGSLKYSTSSSSLPISSGCKLSINKQGAVVTYKVNSSTRCSDYCASDFEGVVSIKVVFYNSVAKQFMRYTRFLELSSSTSFGFSLYNSEALNKIVLRHYSGFPQVYGLWVSNTNLDDYTGIDGVFSTWNPYDKGSWITLSNSNLTAIFSNSNNWESMRGMFPMHYGSGKYYWEVSIDYNSPHNMVGILPSTVPLSNYISYGGGDGYAYNAYNGDLFGPGQSSFGATYGAGDVIGIALDMDNLKLWFSKNGVWQGSGNPDPSTSTSPARVVSNCTYYVAYSFYTLNGQCTINFDEDTFSYQPPVGFDGFSTQGTSNLESQKHDGSYYKYLVTDLKQRYALDFIRNYGSLNDKHNTHLSTDIEFSTSALSNIDDIVWDSTQLDVRWLKIPLLCGKDETTKVIDTLGLYPDITQNLAPGGGNYNCEWELLGDKLANYNTRSNNVALSATVSGSSTVTISGTYDIMDPMSADRTIDGYSGSGFDGCWGFRSDDTDPTLEIELDGLYVINNIQLFHGQGDDTDYTNNDFTIEVTTTSGGPFTEIVSVVGNTELETIHVIDDTPVVFLRVKISKWQYGDSQMYNTDVEATIPLDGGFLREIAIWTTVGGGEISSEDYPVICMDLGYQFNITSHGIINKHNTSRGGRTIPHYMWDNAELFFKYSDSGFDDPHKFIFSDTQTSDYTVYEYTGEFLSSLPDEMSYTFSDNVFFDIGTYIVDWESYSDYGVSTVKLYIINNDYTTTLTPYDKSISGAWASNNNVIQIHVDGYYSINTSRTDDGVWGIRNITITGQSGFVKWVALTCNKATDYSFDGSDKGIKYIDRLKIYGDEKYNPFEYDRWWYSVISSLSNDGVLVKEGKKSLKINYPTSSGIDMLEFLEGDSFGADVNWFEMDALSFWWYIEDIDKLDTSFGGFMFGNLTPQEKPNGVPPGKAETRITISQAVFEDPKKPEYTQIYYLWNISRMNLVSGWNEIKLKFDDFDAAIPPYDGSRQKLDLMLNLRNRNLTSLGMMYKGKGSSFFMCLDSFKIERNRFWEPVKFSNGLCLAWGEFLDIPLSNMTINTGTVEFWMKPYYDDCGVDVFNIDRSRTLFTITNNNNDMVSLGVRSSQWFEIGVGNSDKAYKAITLETTGMVPDNVRFMYKDLVHVALVWSSSGEGMNNGNTVRFYVNGELIISSSQTWVVGDNKSVNLRLGGGNCTLSYNSDHEGSAVFDNLKVYKYCKTTFDIEDRGIDNDSVLVPNNFLQLSSNGVDFYGPNDGMLPLEFEQVPVGEKRSVYLRCNKSKEFKNMIKKTGDLEITWTAVV